MINHAEEIGELERYGYGVRRLGKGDSNTAPMYRVRKGARGRVSVITETALLDLVHREREERARHVRRRGAGT
jgi:hypothetical protein